VKEDSNWRLTELSGCQATWIDRARLQDQQKYLPPVAFNRLWLNCWTSGSGDALPPEDIQAALTLPGPTEAAEPGWTYFAGCDLGLKRDSSALVVLGLHTGTERQVQKPLRLTDREKLLVEAGLMQEPEPQYIQLGEPGTGKLKVVHVSHWQPSAGRKVLLSGVEKAICRLHQRFQFQTIGIDRWQAEYLAERLQQQGLPVELIDFTPTVLKGMCSALLTAFSEGHISLFNHPQLVADLHGLRIVEKQYGMRLDSPRGAGGHGDTATALAIALFLARQSRFSLRPVSDIIIA